MDRPLNKLLVLTMVVLALVIGVLVGVTTWSFTTLNVSRSVDGLQPMTRQEAIAKLYNSTDWPTVQALIKQYGITYIYVGPTERRDFDPTGVSKFDTLKPVCASGNVAVYSAASIGAQPPTAAGS